MVKSADASRKLASNLGPYGTARHGRRPRSETTAHKLRHWTNLSRYLLPDYTQMRHVAETRFLANRVCGRDVSRRRVGGFLLSNGSTFCRFVRVADVHG